MMRALFRYGLEELRHQRQVDHRSFIHDHYISDQLMVCVVAKIGRIRNRAEQSVNRRRVGWHKALISLAQSSVPFAFWTDSFKRAAALPLGAVKSNAKTPIASLFQQER